MPTRRAASLGFLPAVFALTLSATAPVARADGPADNIPDKVRRIPSPGIALPEPDKEELTAGTQKLGAAIAELRKSLSGKPELAALLPDVEVLHKALRYALDHNEIFNVAQIPMAKTVLKLGLERAAQLAEGKHPWTTQPGATVRGYVSKLDGSVQPYGLWIPASFSVGADGAARPSKFRLDLWAHGRNEDLGEVKFIANCLKAGGGEYDFRAKDAFVLQLYGRYCCANKLAGEIDAFEATDAVKRNYPVDENRIVMRGFSMGGAATWHLAVHYTDVWAAAAPGAGFSETPEFLRHFQKETLEPTPWERKLWRLYDATGYAENLANLPVVAYSGEKDIQKQAADIMETAMAGVGLKLTHLVGPGTGHTYHKETKEELNRLVNAAVEKGRNPQPDRVRLVTYTLRYNRMFWVTVDAMERHWEKARVEAALADGKLIATTQGVTRLTLAPAAAVSSVVIDGQPMPTVAKTFRKADGKWAPADAEPPAEGLRKRHGLQGPIDDAFLDAFLMVKPTGKPLNEKVGAWAAGEMAHAVEHWRLQFRGEAPVKTDEEVTDADIASRNLVLWGDPSSNKVLTRIADRLPVRWTAEAVIVGDRKYPSADHVPVLIYPNPLNPSKYVMINSGFTFREYDYLNNARQVPKLPDWAVVDVSKPVTSRAPGGIAAAGFFGERWELTGE
jgi:pimeloyl-ACP methyl ester carboxylesterase